MALGDGLRRAVNSVRFRAKPSSILSDVGRQLQLTSTQAGGINAYQQDPALADSALRSGPTAQSLSTGGFQSQLDSPRLGFSVPGEFPTTNVTGSFGTITSGPRHVFPEPPRFGPNGMPEPSTPYDPNSLNLKHGNLASDEIAAQMTTAVSARIQDALNDRNLQIAGITDQYQGQIAQIDLVLEQEAERFDLEIGRINQLQERAFAETGLRSGFLDDQARQAAERYQLALEGLNLELDQIDMIRSNLGERFGLQGEFFAAEEGLLLQQVAAISANREALLGPGGSLERYKEILDPILDNAIKQAGTIVANGAAGVKTAGAEAQRSIRNAGASALESVQKLPGLDGVALAKVRQMAVEGVSEHGELSAIRTRRDLQALSDSERTSVLEAQALQATDALERERFRLQTSAQFDQQKAGADIALADLDLRKRQAAMEYQQQLEELGLSEQQVRLRMREAGLGYQHSIQGIENDRALLLFGLQANLEDLSFSEQRLRLDQTHGIERYLQQKELSGVDYNQALRELISNWGELPEADQRMIGSVAAELVLDRKWTGDPFEKDIILNTYMELLEAGYGSLTSDQLFLQLAEDQDDLGAAWLTLSENQSLIEEMHANYKNALLTNPFASVGSGSGSQGGGSYHTALTNRQRLNDPMYQAHASYITSSANSLAAAFGLSVDGQFRALDEYADYTGEASIINGRSTRSDHYWGGAIDLTGTPSQMAAAAAYLRTYASSLGIAYVLYGDDAHKDHIHVSYLPPGSTATPGFVTPQVETHDHSTPVSTTSSTATTSTPAVNAPTGTSFI